MELSEVLEIGTDNYSANVDKIIAEKKKSSIDEYLKQLDPKQHAVTDQVKRPNKMKKDESGSSVPVSVARIPIALQKMIVDRAAAFLCGNPPKLISQPVSTLEKDFVSVIDKVWADNKLDYKSMTIARIMMSETECAELWYTPAAEPEYWVGTPAEGPGTKYKPRMRILANSLGDTLYPIFDTAGDMVGFGRGYTVQVGDKKEEHFDLYTNDKIFLGIKTDMGWVAESQPNVVKKIPVIYYSQDQPEWSDVQEQIERLETVISNTADTNDYFGSPIVFVEGNVTGFADKGESGKVLKGTAGGKAYYLTWDRSPESVKMEIENLMKFIYNTTDTPNISLEEMKSLGTFSGIALKMLFLGAHLKAAKKEAIFGEGIQRRINYLKALVGKIATKFEACISLPVSPKFKFYLPENDLEVITMLTDATGSGKSIMSQYTAVKSNPLVPDAEAELQQMGKEGSLGTTMETA